MSGVPEFLVSRGSAAALARCRDSAGLRPERGETVVIRAARGLELAEILCETAGAEDGATGDLVRRATSDDFRRAAEFSGLGQTILDTLHRVIDEQRLPLLPLDIDLTLDGDRADVQVLYWGACTLTPIREDLKREHG